MQRSTLQTFVPNTDNSVRFQVIDSSQYNLSDHHLTSDLFITPLYPSPTIYENSEAKGLRSIFAASSGR